MPRVCKDINRPREAGNATFVNYPDITYKWFDGYGNERKGLEAGTYTVTITNTKLDCSITKKIEILPIKDIPMVEVDKQNIQSCTTNNVPCQGSITLQTNPKYAPYNITWSNGQIGESISGLCAGEYKAVVTNQYGCSIPIITTICCCEQDDIEQGRPVIAAVCEKEKPLGGSPISVVINKITHLKKANDKNGIINLTITGGNNVKIIWSGPNGYFSNAKDISELELGKYNYRVFNGCSEVKGVIELIACDKTDVNVSISTRQGVCASPDGFSCWGNGILKINSSTSSGETPSSGPYTYKWEYPIVPLATPSNDPNVFQLFTCNTYILTITNEYGCQIEKPITISGGKLSDPEIKYDSETKKCYREWSCGGQSFHLDIANSFLTYRFENPNDCREVSCYCPTESLPKLIKRYKLPATVIDPDNCDRGPLDCWETILCPNSPNPDEGTNPLGKTGKIYGSVKKDTEIVDFTMNPSSECDKFPNNPSCYTCKVDVYRYCQHEITKEKCPGEFSDKNAEGTITVKDFSLNDKPEYSCTGWSRVAIIYCVGIPYTYKCYQPAIAEPGGSSKIIMNTKDIKVVSIYPNPFNQNTTVSIENGSDNAVQAAVYDMNNRLVKLFDKQILGTDSIELDLKDLPNALYQLVLQQKDKTMVRLKIVKN